MVDLFCKSKRTLTETSADPSEEELICLQNRDVGVAVAHGLPPILWLSNFDVHPLTLQDFVEVPPDSSRTQQSPYSDVEIAFMVEMPKVMEAQHHVHRDHFAKKRLHDQTTGLIAQREAYLASDPLAPTSQKAVGDVADDFKDQGLMLCKRWLEQIPAVIDYDVDDIQGHQFWPAFLHILHL